MKKTIQFTCGVLAVIIGIFLIARYNKSEAPAPETTTQTPSGTTTTSTEYTIAEVATHKTPTDCWTAINGGVYNVTSWIPQHPGGEQAIISLCGIDGSSAFNGQHGGQARPESELATFKIGTLK